jgi:hypothetical protein
MPLTLKHYEARKQRLKEDGSKDPTLEVADHLWEVMADAYPEIREIKEAKYKDPVSLQNAIRKTAGENFMALIAYATAENLMGTGWSARINAPEHLRDKLAVRLKTGFVLAPDADVLIFSSKYPNRLFMFSIVTSLRDRIGMSMMWGLLFDLAMCNCQFIPRAGKACPVNVHSPKIGLDAGTEIVHYLVTADQHDELKNPMRKAGLSTFDDVFLPRTDRDGWPRLSELFKRFPKDGPVPVAAPAGSIAAAAEGRTT